MDQEKLSLLVGLLSPSLENMGRCFTTNNIINDTSTCIFQTIHVYVRCTECCGFHDWKKIIPVLSKCFFILLYHASEHYLSTPLILFLSSFP